MINFYHASKSRTGIKIGQILRILVASVI